MCILFFYREEITGCIKMGKHGNHYLLMMNGLVCLPVPVSVTRK